MAEALSGGRPVSCAIFRIRHGGRTGEYSPDRRLAPPGIWSLTDAPAVQEVATRLSELLRPGDYIARLSYGAFVFVLGQIEHADEARYRAEQISFAQHAGLSCMGAMKRSGPCCRR